MRANTGSMGVLALESPHVADGGGLGIGHNLSSMRIISDGVADYFVGEDGSLKRRVVARRVQYRCVYFAGAEPGGGSGLPLHAGCWLGGIGMTLQSTDAATLADGTIVTTASVCSGYVNRSSIVKYAASLVVFASRDSGWTWDLRGTIANASDYEYSWYGPGLRIGLAPSSRGWPVWGY